MKQIILFIVATLMSININAQVTLTQAQLDSLPEAVRISVMASVAKEEAKQKVQAVSEYVGLGKEIGEAVNGALGAVEDHVLSIAESDLGQTAIFIVCWKLLYKDIIGIITGFILLIIMCVWMWHSFRFMQSESFSDYSNEGQGAYILICGIGWAALFASSMFCIF